MLGNQRRMGVSSTYVLIPCKCPGCEEMGQPVGTTFKAPRRKNMKDWKQAVETLEKGEIISYCFSKDEEAEVSRDTIHENERMKGKREWKMEKKGRIKMLKTSGEN
ncbi:hypothetical protein BDQ12DRAFT_665600 [Crucibulum laeve]|uniref:Uncharacterized protein n=1 Tax=Crucibulum laeve TaxID=68775 RepID=A0A5C3M216_9AGAR|nr:hypothetical protein BDQ12DRAFT_665600 [Crucibulum laeve]